MFLGLAATRSSAAPTAELRWQQVATFPGGVFDVSGPRSDGRLVVAAREGLFLLGRNGSLTPFARGAGGYAPPAGEAYIALVRAKAAVRGAECSFRRDDLFALDPVDRPGVVLVRRNGRSSRFVDFPAGSFPSAIAADTVGRFGHRLLVTVQLAGRTTLYAIDCRGRMRVVVRDAPKVEGGSAVAPATFGRFGGSLIAPDEHSGRIYAFRPGGQVRRVIRLKLPAGADIGVESLGFVPSRFTRRAAAYLADYDAPGAPTPGTSSLLRIKGGGLARVGVRAGDLVVATEAAGVTRSIRCTRRCTVRQIGRALDATHAEGHIAFQLP
jgi:hypothetical protein